MISNKGRKMNELGSDDDDDDYDIHKIGDGKIPNRREGKKSFCVGFRK